ncbi:substrate-binding periplasmic protein [Magnetofaba australis]|nr:transporter substrate-binding domain-containing protein [Magnetofaba australis]
MTSSVLQHFALRLGALAALCALLLPSPARAADTLELLVFERPPYYVKQLDGSMGGLVAGRAGEALRRAGVTPIWKEVASNRHLSKIKRNRKAACAVGWFKNPERETYAKFSDPIYRDRPMAALRRAEDARFDKLTSLHDLLAAQEVKLGIKLGFSMGAEVDAMMAELKTPTVKVAQDNIGLLRMLSHGEIDYMFVAAEEAESLLGKFERDGKSLTEMHPEGAPEGNKRYLLCSQKTPDAWIEKVNAALADMTPN